VLTFKLSHYEFTINTFYATMSFWHGPSFPVLHFHFSVNNTACLTVTVDKNISQNNFFKYTHWVSAVSNENLSMHFIGILHG